MRVVLMTGKGGVGKTTLAAATARGLRVGEGPLEHLEHGILDLRVEVAAGRVPPDVLAGLLELLVVGVELEVDLALLVPV